MTMRKRWGMLAVALAAALSLAPVDRATAAPDPVGTWYSFECIYEIQLRADGTFLEDDGAGTYSGTWRVDGAVLTLTNSDNGKTDRGTFTDDALVLAGCVFNRQ